jgi:hypothetical protein
MAASAGIRVRRTNPTMAAIQLTKKRDIGRAEPLERDGRHDQSEGWLIASELVGYGRRRLLACGDRDNLELDDIAPSRDPALKQGHVIAAH